MPLSQLEMRRETFSLLSWHMHTTDRSPRDTLDRLVMKACEKDISEMDLTIRETYTQLRHMYKAEGAHDGVEPKRTDVPFILFRQGKKLHILDGRNRYNLYIANHDKDCHRCLVVAGQCKS